MYWKIVRWGGTIAILAMIGFAVLASSSDPSQNHPSSENQGIRLN